jgi:hypothetical protein
MSTLNLQPDATAGKDSYILDGAPGNYGTETFLQLGNDAGTATWFYIQFDISAIVGIGATVSSAVLKLYRYAQANDGNLNQFVKYCTSSWAEGTVSGETKPSVNATKYGEGQKGYNTSAWVEFDITTLIQSLADEDFANNGFLVDSDNEDWGQRHRYYSSDYTTDTSLTPKLDITYSGGSTEYTKTLTLSDTTATNSIIRAINKTASKTANISISNIRSISKAIINNANTGINLVKGSLYNKVLSATSLINITRIRDITKILFNTGTANNNISSNILKTISGNINVLCNSQRNIFKSIVNSATSTNNLIRLCTKELLLSAIGSGEESKQINVSIEVLTDVISITIKDISKDINNNINSAINKSINIFKEIINNLIANIDLIKGSLYLKTIDITALISVLQNKSISKIISKSITISNNIVRNIFKEIVSSTGLLCTISRNILKNIVNNIVIAVSLVTEYAIINLKELTLTLNANINLIKITSKLILLYGYIANYKQSIISKNISNYSFIVLNVVKNIFKEILSTLSINITIVKGILYLKTIDITILLNILQSKNASKEISKSITVNNNIVRNIIKVIIINISLIGTMSRNILKDIVNNVSIIIDLITEYAIIKFKELTLTLNVNNSLNKITSKIIELYSYIAGYKQSLTLKNVNNYSIVTLSIVKNMFKEIASTLNVNTTIVKGILSLKDLICNLTISNSITKIIFKAIRSDSLITMVKSLEIIKYMNNYVSSTINTVKSTFKNISSIVNSIVSLIYFSGAEYVKELLYTTIISNSLGRNIFKTIEGTINSSINSVKNIIKSINNYVISSITILKQMTKTITNLSSINLTLISSMQYLKSIVSNIIINNSLSKNVYKAIVNTLEVVNSIERSIIKSLNCLTEISINKTKEIPKIFSNSVKIIITFSWATGETFLKEITYYVYCSSNILRSIPAILFNAKTRIFNFIVKTRIFNFIVKSKGE